MTPELNERTLSCGGHILFNEVAPEIVSRLPRREHGLFLSVAMPETFTRFKVRLGQSPDLVRYSVCHRYEPYWMKPAVGRDLSRVPPETQFLLGRVGNLWLLLVPLVDDPLRFSLQGGKDGLYLLAETGDAKLPAAEGVALYVACGEDPFLMMPACAEEVAAHLGLERLRRHKPLPKFVDELGWCTWDAFYADVSADKVREGLEQFRSGGVTPKLMILDDGWLDFRRMPTGEKRLVSFQANKKFENGLEPLVTMAKSEFGIETFLVWHTVVGYWGGTDKSLGYGVIDQVRHFGEGILAHLPHFNNDWWGELVGYVPTQNIAAFYDDFHRSLRASGVDGVKVDSQALLEGVSQGQGGRVAVSRAYRKALEASVEKHFAGALINCMSNAQETWYCSPGSTLLRSSMDFLPNNPESHGLHLYTNALVGLWFGEFMHPDWDMFQSGHGMGAFHAAGRAVSGSPVYVSDKPGHHDFGILRKLVCSDGRVLRADQPGLPTLDCLLVDPTKEASLLKIWNRNGEAAIMGAFNCYYQEGEHQERVVRGQVSPSDVPGLRGERFAVWLHEAGRLLVLEPQAALDVELGPREFELFSMVPINDGFAALGLTDKYNSHAAISVQTGDKTRRELELLDGGSFAAYTANAPSGVLVNGDAVPFAHDPKTGLLRVSLEAPGAQRLVVRW